MSLTIFFNDGKGREWKKTILLDEVTSPPVEQKNKFFMLYYGNPMDGNFDKIVDAKPDFVIFASRDPQGRLVLTKDAVTAYHNKGIKVIGYVPENYFKEQLQDVGRIKTEVSVLMKNMVDGIFLDENDSTKVAENKVIYDYIKSFVGENLVIVNPGVVPRDNNIFQFCDVCCIENYWFKDVRFLGETPDRFMAVQGDPGTSKDADFQSADTLSVAVGRLKTARKNGILYYYSGYQNHHWMIPPFLKEFAEQAR